jgi:hypothetical protein
MATIVEHKPTGETYTLLGTGFGAYRATRPSVFFGSLIPKEDEGELAMVAVCDREGNIGWIPSEELLVVEIDGKAPSDV